MFPKYVPINRAKKGEFDAYKNLDKSIKRSILPIFELPTITGKMLESGKYSSRDNPIEYYIQNKSFEIHDAIGADFVGVDIYNWSPNSTIESGEHILGYISSCLNNLGCRAIPVIGYDRWEDTEYSTVLKQLSKNNSNFIIRFDEDAFQDMLEEDFFLETLDEIFLSLNLNSSNVGAVLDLGDISKNTSSIISLQEKTLKALKIIRKYNFGFISIAGCSVTSDINGMVSAINSESSVIRKELKVWKTIKKFNSETNLIFGDYGIVNPTVSEDIIAPNANGKIRYTTEDSYFVVRGYPKNSGAKGAQMHELCRRLIKSGNFNGSSFSWGDHMIKICADEGNVEGKKTAFKGSSTDWVAIDSTHHMTYVINEVKEFELNLSVPKTYKEINF